MIKIKSALLVLISTLFVNTSNATEILRIGSIQAEDDPIAQGFYKFKEGVESKTNGEIKVQVFMNGQIGNVQDMMDQALAGANVASFTDASRLADYVPEIGIVGAPFVFSSYEQANHFVSTNTFKKWSDNLYEQSGLTILAFNWYLGPRYLVTKKMIDSTSDIEGLRIRSPSSPTWMAGVKALGAVPTPMDWSEVYPGMQLGAIDGAGATPSSIWGGKLYEVANDITTTSHIQLITGIVVGKKFWGKLTPEQKEILKEEAVEAGNYMSSINIKKGNEYLNKIKDLGVRVHSIDTASLRDNAISLYPELGLENAYNQVISELNNM